jgi:hypothetical protein
MKRLGVRLVIGVSINHTYISKACAPTAMHTQDSPTVAINNGRRNHLRGSRCPEGNNIWAGIMALLIVVGREKLSR